MRAILGFLCLWIADRFLVWGVRLLLHHCGAQHIHHAQHAVTALRELRCAGNATCPGRDYGNAAWMAIQEHTGAV